MLCVFNSEFAPNQMEFVLFLEGYFCKLASSKHHSWKLECNKTTYGLTDMRPRNVRKNVKRE